MAEEDYEVDENGARKTHQHQLTVDELVQGQKPKGKARSKRKRSAPPALKGVSKRKSGRSSVVAQKLPKTQCPDCKKTMTSKALGRHRREKHGNKTFKCNICGMLTKRESVLRDHQRRMHFEPASLGRPRKNARAPHRERSPFRVDVFEKRHGKSLEILEDVSSIKQSLENNEKRVMVLEESKKKEENESRKIKSRVTLLESRQKEVALPSLRDIPSCLEFLNLNSFSTKDDIRTTINLRLMEISSESNISNEIFTSKKLTEEKRLKLTMFYNAASDVLMKWIKKNKN